MKEMRRQSYGLPIFFHILVQKEGDRTLNLAKYENKKGKEAIEKIITYPIETTERRTDRSGGNK